MAEAKEVSLLLRITSIANLGALSGVHDALGKITKQAGLANLSFGKVAVAAGAVLLGLKGIQSIGSFLGEGIAAAKEARKVNEGLGLALARNPKLAKMGAEVIKGQQKELIALANKMSKTGITSATSLAAGFAGLAKAGFGPKSIEKISKGFEGVNVAMKGVNATAADTADTAAMVSKAMKTGSLKAFAAKGLVSKEEIKNFSKLSSNVDKANFFLKLFERNAYRVGDAATTMEGKIAKTNIIWSQLKETLGAPFVDTQLAFAEAMGELGDALSPVAEELANMMSPAMREFATWIRDQTPAIRNFGFELTNFFASVGKYFGGAEFATSMKGVGDAFNELGKAIGLGDIFKQNEKASQEFLNPATGSYEKLNKESELAMGFTSGLTRELEDLKKLIQAITTAINELKQAWDFFTKGKLPEVDQAAKDAALADKDLRHFITTGKEAPLTIPSQVISEAEKARAEEKAFISGKGMRKLPIPQKEEIAAAAITPKEDMKDFMRTGKVAAKIPAAAPVPTALVDTIEKVSPAIDDAKASTDELKTSFDFTTTSVEYVGTAASTVQSTLDAWNTNSLNSSIDTSITKVGELKTAISSMPSAGGVPANFRGMPTGQLGGLMTRPTIIGEAGPEMAIPMEDTPRSRSLLEAAMNMIGLDLSKINIGGFNASKVLQELEPGPVGAAENLGRAQEKIFHNLEGGQTLAQTASALGMRNVGNGGGGNPISLSMNSPITINGVDGSQVGGIAKEVESALASQTAYIRNMLVQLMKAKDEERRMSYV